MSSVRDHVYDFAIWMGQFAAVIGGTVLMYDDTLSWLLRLTGSVVLFAGVDWVRRRAYVAGWNESAEVQAAWNATIITRTTERKQK